MALTKAEQDKLNSRLRAYQDKVFKELEYLEYPGLVLEFDEIDIARAIFTTCVLNDMLGISPKMSAIIIWSMTMNFQILPPIKDAVKH